MQIIQKLFYILRNCSAVENEINTNLSLIFVFNNKLNFHYIKNAKLLYDRAHYLI